jgi:uncharacterized BrkB/YihY/UPF0761 family membrane protein
MNDDIILLQIEEQQLRDQWLMNESAQWITDEVHRDMMWGERKKPAAGRRSQRTSLIVFLIFVLLMAGTFFVFVHALQPTSAELYQQELVRQLHTDSLGNRSESYKAYERMNQEMDHFIQKEEEHRRKLLFGLAVCALAPLWFVGYLLVQYFKDRTYRPGRREVLLVTVVTLATAIVLYVVDVFFYIRFDADRKIRELFMVLVGLAAIGWLVFQLRKGKKGEE